MCKMSVFIFSEHIKCNPPVYFVINISIDRLHNRLFNVIFYNIFPLTPSHFYNIKVSTTIHAPTTVVNP